MVTEGMVVVDADIGLCVGGALGPPFRQVIIQVVLDAEVLGGWSPVTDSNRAHHAQHRECRMLLITCFMGLIHLRLCSAELCKVVCAVTAVRVKPHV